MPNWKKLIVSGSDASLNTLFVRNAISASSVTASIVSASSGITGSLFGTASYVNGNIHTSTNPALSSSYSSQSATVSVNTPAGITTIHGIVMATGSTANAPSILRAETGTTGLRYDLGNNELLVDRLNVRLTTKLSGSLDIVGTPTTVHTITGSLRVSGSSHIITGSVSITGSLNATSSWATNAITASYVIGYPRIVQSGSADGTTTTGFPFTFVQSNSLLAASQYLLRASASFVSLPAGTYSIYLDFCFTGGGGQIAQPQAWITPTVTPTINLAPKTADPNLVLGSLAQSVNYSGGSVAGRIICNTNKFSIGSTTQFYIVIQNTIAASTISNFTVPIGTGPNGDTRTRQYIVYKHD